MAARSRSRWIDFVLFILFLVIIYIFIIRRSYMSKVNLNLDDTKHDQKGLDAGQNNAGILPVDAPILVPKKAIDVTKDEQDQSRINEIIHHIPDFRSDTCKTVGHGAEIPTSFILDFFDYSFYDMRVTITSILKLTPESLIREIIIVDDGSTLDHIIGEAKSYAAKIPKSVYLRNEDRQGQGKARMRGAKEAMGANLVFIDSNAVVSPGWLEPLAAFIQHEQNVIAVPHLDRVNDPVSYEFHKTEEGVVASLNWGLEVVMSRTTDVLLKDKPYASPMIRGSVFAVTKEYIRDIGGLDSLLSDGGGDVLELSLRTWLCGGSVKVIPCSRVGMLNFNNPVKIINNKNKWRITELWMTDFKDIITRTAAKDLASNVGDLDRTSLETKKQDIGKLQCKHDIKWFFETIAKDVFIPPSNSKVQGILQIKNGHCARIGKDKRIDLGSCNPDKNQMLLRDMMFVLTTDGLLKVGNQCINMVSSSYMVADDCKSQNDHQKWTYNDRKRLINNWSKFCAMHVTDPDPKYKEHKRQIVMAQKCESDKSKDLEFSSWKFLMD